MNGQSARAMPPQPAQPPQGQVSPDQLFAAMAQNALGGAVAIANQIQLPNEQRPRAILKGLAMALRTLAVQTNIPEGDVLDEVARALGIQEEMRARHGKKALALLARGMETDGSGEPYCAGPVFAREALSLLEEAGIGTGTVTEEKPAVEREIEEEEACACNARLPRLGARCTLPPHGEKGKHRDEVARIEWDPGSA